MSADDKHSLADEAAAWVPPWARQPSPSESPDTPDSGVGREPASDGGPDLEPAAGSAEADMRAAAAAEPVAEMSAAVVAAPVAESPDEASAESPLAEAPVESVSPASSVAGRPVESASPVAGRSADVEADASVVDSPADPPAVSPVSPMAERSADVEGDASLAESPVESVSPVEPPAAVAEADMPVVEAPARIETAPPAAESPVEREAVSPVAEHVDESPAEVEADGPVAEAPAEVEAVSPVSPLAEQVVEPSAETHPDASVVELLAGVETVNPSVTVAEAAADPELDLPTGLEAVAPDSPAEVEAVAPVAEPPADSEPHVEPTDVTEPLAETTPPTVPEPLEVAAGAESDLEPLAAGASRAERGGEPVAEAEAEAPGSLTEADPLAEPESIAHELATARDKSEESELSGEAAQVAATSTDLDGTKVELSDDELRGAVEAILLIVDEPVTEIILAQVLDQPVDRIAGVLERCCREYAEMGRGFELRRIAGGWRLYTRPEYAAYVEKFVLDGQQVRLTQAALETLAVVAYKQPVTRSRISAIRGVNCDGVVRTLVARGLIEECGSEPESGAFLYRTTTLFLEKLGLDSVDELPPLAPFLPDDVDEIADAQR